MNLAAALKAIHDARAQGGDGTVATLERPPAPTLPEHPPLLPCGCDGSGWRAIAARTLAGGEVERVTRCICWLRQHPPAPKPVKKRPVMDSRAVPRVGRDRQFKDND